MRKGTAQHSIAAKCHYHRDCSVLRSAKAFSADNQSRGYDRIMAWMYEGASRVPNRSHAFAHKQLYGVLRQHVGCGL